MIKNIMVCLDGSRHSDIACEYALHLSQQLSARLTGLHILDSRMLEGPLMADISGWIGAQPYGSQLQQFRDVLERKGETIVEAFNHRCEQAGIPADGALKMGHPSRVIVEEENRTELLIIGQRGQHADIVGEALGSTAERVLRHSIKPCLVTPSEFQPINKIMAAYDGSGHASQGLHVAIELAKALNVELIILTVTEGKEIAETERISAEGLKLAESHDCRATNLIVENHRSSQGILESAQEQECHLIVMGAYGHSRIRELILGSTTMNLMTRSHLPVMLVR